MDENYIFYANKVKVYVWWFVSDYSHKSLDNFVAKN